MVERGGEGGGEIPENIKQIILDAAARGREREARKTDNEERRGWLGELDRARELPLEERVEEAVKVSYAIFCAMFRHPEDDIELKELLDSAHASAHSSIETAIARRKIGLTGLTPREMAHLKAVIQRDAAEAFAGIVHARSATGHGQPDKETWGKFKRYLELMIHTYGFWTKH